MYDVAYVAEWQANILHGLELLFRVEYVLCMDPARHLRTAS